LSGAHAHTDTFLGTMAYLSPERITTRDYSYPSDVWALGISMIYCATGNFPIDVADYWILVCIPTLFTSESPFPVRLLSSRRICHLHQVDKIAHAPPPSLSTEDGHSAELCDFVAQCLITDPEKRAKTSELLAHPFLRDTTDTSNESYVFALPSPFTYHNCFHLHVYYNSEWQSKSNDVACFQATIDCIINRFGRGAVGTCTDTGGFRSDFELDLARLRVIADQFALTVDQVRTGFAAILSAKCSGTADIEGPKKLRDEEVEEEEMERTRRIQERGIAAADGHPTTHHSRGDSDDEEAAHAARFGPPSTSHTTTTPLLSSSTTLTSPTDGPSFGASLSSSSSSSAAAVSPLNSQSPASPPTVSSPL
jgi:serine/threonine protein kinase